MTKAQIDKLHDAVEKALENLEKEHQVKLTKCNASYDAASVSLSIKFEGTDDNSKQIQENRDNMSFQLSGSSLRVGDKLLAKGKKFTVVGFNGNAPKNAVQMEDESGTRYKTSIKAAESWKVR